MRATVVAVLVLLAACGGSSKSQTPDQKLAKVARQVCAMNDKEFGYFVAINVDQGHRDDGTLDDIRKRCGSRLDAALAALGS